MCTQRRSCVHLVNVTNCSLFPMLCKMSKISGKHCTIYLLLNSPYPKIGEIYLYTLRVQERMHSQPNPAGLRAGCLKVGQQIQRGTQCVSGQASISRRDMSLYPKPINSSHMWEIEVAFWIIYHNWVQRSWTALFSFQIHGEGTYM